MCVGDVCVCVPVCVSVCCVPVCVSEYVACVSVRMQYMHVSLCVVCLLGHLCIGVYVCMCLCTWVWPQFWEGSSTKGAHQHPAETCKDHGIQHLVDTNKDHGDRVQPSGSSL